MYLKFYDLDMEAYNSLDIRDVIEITSYEDKIIIENVNGLLFTTNKITVDSVE